mmetsp:Transcript_96821/g.289171  ORF Transcript_96821/g.289171 Transcript_96821/m.289171 type:complete len:233 (-) Transcript_96821:551-1249(-)
MSRTSSSSSRFCMATRAARCSALPSMRSPPRAASKLKNERCVPARPCAAPSTPMPSCLGTMPLLPGLRRPTISLPTSSTPSQHRPPHTMPPASPVPQERKRPTLSEAPKPAAPYRAEASPSLTSRVAHEAVTAARSRTRSRRAHSKRESTPAAAALSTPPNAGGTPMRRPPCTQPAALRPKPQIVLLSYAGHCLRAARAASARHARCCSCDVKACGSTYLRSPPSRSHQRVT